MGPRNKAYFSFTPEYNFSASQTEFQRAGYIFQEICCRSSQSCLPNVFCDSNKFYSMGMQMVKYELSTVRAVLTAANKNVAARRFSATFQLFQQLLFRRRPGFLQVFLFTLSTTCLYHPCISYLLYKASFQMLKCSNIQCSDIQILNCSQD